MKLLHSRKTPDYDIGKTLAETNKDFGPRSVDKFHFYAYAKSYWQQHIYSSGQEPVIYDLLLRLCKQKTVSEVEHNRRGWWDATVTTGGEERAREGGEATTRHREGRRGLEGLSIWSDATVVGSGEGAQGGGEATTRHREHEAVVKL